MHDEPIWFNPMLEHLRESKPRAVEAFELYEGGCSLKEIATQQNVNWRTVAFRVQYVRHWLEEALSGESSQDKE